MLAFGISAAGQKLTIATLLYNHRTAAFFTNLPAAGLTGWLHWFYGTFFGSHIIAGPGAFRIAFACQKRSVFTYFDTGLSAALGARKTRGQAQALNA
jgi:hypothetical protein